MPQTAFLGQFPEAILGVILSLRRFGYDHVVLDQIARRKSDEFIRV